MARHMNLRGSLRWVFLTLVLLQMACVPSVVVGEGEPTMGEEVQERMEEAMDTAGGYVEEAYESVQESVEETMEPVVEKIDEVVEETKAKVEEVVPKKETKASEALEKIKTKVAAAIGIVVDKSKEVADRAKSMSKQDAKKVAAAALGVWGVSVGVGWLAQTVAKDAPPAPTAGKKGRK